MEEIVMYKVGDNIFNTKEDAENAEKEILKKLAAETDEALAKHIRSNEYHFTRKIENLRLKYPATFVTRDKHDINIHLVNNEDDIKQISLNYVRNRLRDGWFVDYDKKLAEAIVKHNSGSAAFIFLWDRAYNRHQYEVMELKDFHPNEWDW